MKILCKICGIAVSTELEELKDRNLLDEEDDSPFLPQGYYFISDGEYFTGSEQKIIIDLEDITHTQNHPDSNRLNGCCGIDGTGGINTVCENGHEVGTLKSDCWMPHCMIFEPDLIKISKGKARKL